MGGVGWSLVGLGRGWGGGWLCVGGSQWRWDWVVMEWDWLGWRRGGLRWMGCRLGKTLARGLVVCRVAIRLRKHNGPHAAVSIVSTH